MVEEDVIQRIKRKMREDIKTVYGLFVFYGFYQTWFALSVFFLTWLGKPIALNDLIYFLVAFNGVIGFIVFILSLLLHVAEDVEEE